MENPFKEILHQEALPETLKDKAIRRLKHTSRSKILRTYLG